MADMEFVKESDLMDINIMSVIQARKVFKILNSGTTLPVPEDDISTGLDNISESSSSFTSTPSPHVTNPPQNSPNSSLESDRDQSSSGKTISLVKGNWLSRYEIPWDSFPKAFLKSCKENKCPTSSDMREVVRILVDDILHVCKKPSARDIYIIAARLIDQYRTSLLDRIGDRIIGTGYSSLINKIQDRINNVNRKSMSNNGGGDEPMKRKLGYGHLPADSDLGDISREEAVISKEFLQRQAGKEDIDYTLVMEAMTKTYSVRQKEIIGMNIKEIEHNWPFMFLKMCCLKHFENLTGVNLSREFQINSAKTKKTFLSYMEGLKVRNNLIRNIWNDMDEYQQIADKPYPETLSLLRLLLGYFKEHGLIEYHPLSSDRKIIEKYLRSEGAPVLAVVGNLYESPIFHVIIESKIIQSFQTIDDALLVMFAMYFIMNLRYLKSAYLSLEFLQRTFFGVNPTRGTKGKKKTKNSVHPKVLQLTTELRTFEQAQESQESD